ncbi:MAG: PSD1 domain-containing protein [Bryobacterales bacterium]|nr:PSD1 domain-containing protein [Bryobacterales bacterium]
MLLFALAAIAAFAQDDTLFEKRVRPVLVARCTGCHGAGKQFSGLRVDSREALINGGQRGPALTPGSAASSPLMKAIRHEGALKMPPGGKLSDAEIAAIGQWIDQGARWPAARQTTPDRYTELVRSHWAFRQVRPQPQGSIDGFLKSEQPLLDRRSLYRRLANVLTGLPPDPRELEAFVKSGDYEKAVDRLLASPHYGEQQARWWLDLMRFGETRGYEWNYEITGAWRYRDYLIRAFNDDLPYDQLVREHVAGDLLPDARPESPIGTAFYRLGEAGHDDCVQFREIATDVIDNQIDTLTKAFQGLTVSCARCHDHKLDPIPTADYYALYGILNSSRPVVHVIGQPKLPAPRRPRLTVIGTPKLQGSGTQSLDDPATARALIDKDPHEARKRYKDEHRQRLAFNARNFAVFDQGWTASGAAQANATGHAVIKEGKLEAILPKGFTNWSARLAGALRSPNLPAKRKYLSIRAAGGQLAAHRVLIDNCAIGEGYKPIGHASPQWIKLDVSARDSGLPVFVELVTRWENPRYPDRPGVLKADQLKQLDAKTSWWSLSGAVLHEIDETPRDPLDHLLLLFEVEGTAMERVTTVIARAVERWNGNKAGEADVKWLDWALRQGVLSAEAVADPEISTPNVVEGLADAGQARDFPVFLSGNAQSAGPLTPRRYLSRILGGPPLGDDRSSGRLQLAGILTSPANPLTARVMVNRLWHHTFGKGIVASVDNFGVLGDPPTHPELLDWLAGQFVDSGWSVKKMMRLLVTSQAFQQRATPRRRTAEELRDAILSAAGELNPALYGESIHPARKEAQEYRRLFSGPIDGGGRRSLYTKVTRMQGPAFLETFDYPSNMAARGSRDITNVPAQALTLLNDPFVVEMAQRWASKLAAIPEGERVDTMFRTALARPVREDELARFNGLAAELKRLGSDNVWKDVAHAIFNLKEFLYVP